MRDKWFVIQRRQPQTPQENFYRNWADYKKGFGDEQGEFWLGNDKIHQLTKKGNMKLRVEMWDDEGIHAYAEYSTFRISDESDKYRLTISGYSGSAGDSMTEASYSINNMQFSTKDQDNDSASYLHCAQL